MRMRYLGKTGVSVSEICLGTMTFGNEADEATSAGLMDHAFQAGVNFFDTANIYNGGRSEEIVGRWLKGRREAIVLATKCHFPTGDGPNERGSSRRNILLSVEKSLARLGTDWIDLLYLHHWDSNTAIEESLAAVDALVRQGKVLYAAASNFAAWQVMKAAGIAERRGFGPITAIQPMYNLLKRQAEVEILPMAQSEGIAVCPYNPMAAGMLTGKYLRGEQGRLDVNQVYKKRYGAEHYPEVSRDFVVYAQERGVSPAALAVAWVASHPAVTSAIIGARNLDQLRDTLGCAAIALTAEERAEISALSPAPPLATDREG